ncbi:sigma-54-dependent Fis family transcriptional regulator [Limibaculum sp. M0105]|uniref:DNA-binding transcriptional regulator NtrC n=2 Tax=Thermohalobaculum xanthum TaxID=2753746 RepID=A0A8J7SDI7_9RHOB|nr:sigma-54-dependent Fis family transcriptional regulator [Thermohalobaculum xanthum]
MAATVLVADDDRLQRNYLSAVLSSAGFTIEACEGGAAALDRLTRRDSRIDICLLDLNMPDLDGFGVLERMHAAGIDMPVIVLTADGSVKRAVDAMRAGAVDFLVKPVGPERLEVSIRNALEMSNLTSEVQRLTRQESDRLGFDDLIAASTAIRESIALARRGASTDIPVLISGESGTGKEVFARAMHGAGPRSGQPFVAVNCGALPGDMVESILFGHEKGAFAGATERRPGKFQEASGGTLFLDEVGELPMPAQVKLLRAIQTGEIDPVGATGSFRVDIRLISTTNRDLRAMVAKGTFREDLYYRLSVFPLTLPPLRERRADISGLAEMFLARYRGAAQVRLQGFSQAAIEAMRRADWPGNVRQLENVIHRAVVLADGPLIRPEHLVGLDSTSTEVTEKAHVNGNGNGHRMHTPEIGVDILQRPDGHTRTLAEIEAEVIRRALGQYRGRMAEVARRLGIGRSTLYRKLDDYDIRKPGA